MLFALPRLFILSLCLSSICGNDVTEKNTEGTAHFSAASRPLPQRNQTKVTRDDQLLSLAAARRRRIIADRFKNHLKTLVDLSTTGSKNISNLPKLSETLPNKTINVHLSLSDLLHYDAKNSEEHASNINSPSTESNVVNVSSPRSIHKFRKNGGNGEPPQIQENKTKHANAPIIRNILFRRKMSFLNPKLPLDIDQIAFDTLGLSEINKNTDDLVLDNEDSLQVEESAHDKLIYYDVKNNASKKSMNNFDASEEMKGVARVNKTSNPHKDEANNSNNSGHDHHRTTTHKPEVVTKNITDSIKLNKTISNNKEDMPITTLRPIPKTHLPTTTFHPITNISISQNKSSVDEIDIVFNNTDKLANETFKQKSEVNNTKTLVDKNKFEPKAQKNNTRFMSPSLYSYFRPLDVPEEEMQPFLHFGEKLPTTKTLPRNQSSKPVSNIGREKTFTDENIATSKHEEEVDENMDVSVIKPIYENKIPKINLPNPKVNAAREYFKNRNQNKISKNITETNTVAKSDKKHISTIDQLRNMPRNRGFRNRTLFTQEKRNGVRHVVHLTRNRTIANLKPTFRPEVTTTTTEHAKTFTVTLAESELTSSEDYEESITTTEPESEIKELTTLSENIPLLKISEKDLTDIPEPKPETNFETKSINTTANPATTIQTPTIEHKWHSKITIPTTEAAKLALEISTEKAFENQTEAPITIKPEITTKSQQRSEKLTTITTEKSELQTQKTTKTPKIQSTTTTRTTRYETTTATIPTTRILSTAVVTSVSVESSKSKPSNKTEEKTDSQLIKTEDLNATDINDPDATVVAALSNYTSQAFQNNTKYDSDFAHPARRYPNNMESHISPEKNYPMNKPFVSPEINTQMNKSFILRPNKTRTFVEKTPTTTGFIIHVPDIETPTDATEITSKIHESDTMKPDVTTPEIETETTELDLSNVKIGTRINLEAAIEEEITENETTTPEIITIKPTQKHSSEATTQRTEHKTTIASKVFNTTMSKPDLELELPIATLFSITDFKKPETVENNTKYYTISGTETVILRKNESDLSFDNVHAVYILAALGFLPMMVIVIYVVRSVFKKKDKNMEDYEAELHDSEKKSIINPVARLPALVLDSSNRWEFPRSKLRLQTLLGQGNFGQVWKAEADDLKGHIGLTRLVAVKTIKDGAGSKERDELLKELAIMQKMGSHPNVVTLLGCCTDKEPYLLIMEYVMYGKLLTFLRDHRTRRDYYNFSDDAATLTARDLTVFAYCCARGMEYLASKGILHRDLAARNVLVDHNKLCKIADFGMSRDTPSGEVNEPRQPRNALPVRWMAIESLLYSIFTHKTDVWSFGVLLWEIVTLGSSPYANMSGREVMRLVCDGYRLERPNHCKPELYRVMARTWNADPNQRPSFAELRSELAEMLENTNAEGSYVDLESFRADSTVYEIDNCTPRGNYFTVKSRFSEFECEI